MKRSKPTPGPWESHYASLSDNTLVVTAKHPTEDGFERICTVRRERDYSDDDYRAQANARLIGAAPDLLAAIRPVLAEAKERADYLHDTWNLDAHVELTLTIAELRAMHEALVKAEGR